MEMMISRNGPYINVHVDEEQNIVHILDLDSGRTVTNAVDEEFLVTVAKSVGVDVKSVGTWLLYHTDGFISNYDGFFRFVAHDDERTHRPFVDVMKQRQF